MDDRNNINEVKKALADFIIRSAQKNAPSYAVQVLPEAIKSYIELLNFH